MLADLTAGQACRDHLPWRTQMMRDLQARCGSSASIVHAVQDMQHAILVESARARHIFAGGTREALGSQRVEALNNREGGGLRCALFVFLR
eukprot:3339256-Alexandrium_andersonii.AAC.1